MGFSRMSIPSVACPFPVAAAENYNLRGCIYLADHTEVRSVRIWCKWAEGSRSSPGREANSHCSAGNASLGKPCPGRGQSQLHGFVHGLGLAGQFLKVEFPLESK